MEIPLVVYVDVDDTLIRSTGRKRIPIVQAVEHIRQLHSCGAELYCWSTGGANYAKETAQELGIAECFVAFLPKPNVLIDDQAVADWRLCVEVHPLNVPSRSLETYLQEIKKRK